MPGKKIKVKKKEKKVKVKKKKGPQPYKKKRACPKCGPGINLAEHKNRFSCGKCGYYERRQ